MSLYSLLLPSSGLPSTLVVGSTSLVQSVHSDEQSRSRAPVLDRAAQFHREKNHLENQAIKYGRGSTSSIKGDTVFRQFDRGQPGPNLATIWLLLARL